MNVAIKSFVLILLLISNVSVHAEEQADNPNILSQVETFYSESELKAMLAFSSNAEACVAEKCDEHQQFDANIMHLGELLSARAYERYPTLKQQVPAFAFTVVEKSEIALASNKVGHIVVFRGVQQLSLSDHALQFLLAREMAHVIAKHHDKNISTKLLISALTAVAFPAVAILAASRAAAEVSTVTSVVSSAASTATSLVGSEVAIAKLKPRQLLEADTIALELTQEEEIDFISLGAELNIQEQPTSWLVDLKKTQAYIAQIAEEKADEMLVELDNKNAQQEPASED